MSKKNPTHTKEKKTPHRTNKFLTIFERNILFRQGGFVFLLIAVLVAFPLTVWFLQDFQGISYQNGTLFSTASNEPCPGGIPFAIFGFGGASGQGCTGLETVAQKNGSDSSTPNNGVNSVHSDDILVEGTLRLNDGGPNKQAIYSCIPGDQDNPSKIKCRGYCPKMEESCPFKDGNPSVCKVNDGGVGCYYTKPAPDVPRNTGQTTGCDSITDVSQCKNKAGCFYEDSLGCQEGTAGMLCNPGTYCSTAETCVADTSGNKNMCIGNNTGGPNSSCGMVQKILGVVAKKVPNNNACGAGLTCDADTLKCVPGGNSNNQTPPSTNSGNGNSCSSVLGYDPNSMKCANLQPGGGDYNYSSVNLHECQAGCQGNTDCSEWSYIDAGQFKGCYYKHHTSSEGICPGDANGKCAYGTNRFNGPDFGGQQQNPNPPAQNPPAQNPPPAQQPPSNYGGQSCTGSVTVTWDPINVENATAIYFDAKKNVDPNWPATGQQLPVTATSTVLTGPGNTQYQWRVWVQTGDGFGNGQYVYNGGSTIQPCQ